MGINRFPNQLLRSYKRHEENKRKIGQECSSMQQAHSMNARKCIHAQKPYPSHAFAHESSKVKGRGERETEAKRLMERKAASLATECDPPTLKGNTKNI